MFWPRAGWKLKAIRARSLEWTRSARRIWDCEGHSSKSATAGAHPRWLVLVVGLRLTSGQFGCSSAMACGLTITEADRIGSEAFAAKQLYIPRFLEVSLLALAHSYPAAERLLQYNWLRSWCRMEALNVQDPDAHSTVTYLRRLVAGGILESIAGQELA